MQLLRLQIEQKFLFYHGNSLYGLPDQINLLQEEPVPTSLENYFSSSTI